VEKDTATAMRKEGRHSSGNGKEFGETFAQLQLGYESFISTGEEGAMHQVKQEGRELGGIAGLKYRNR